MSSRKSSSSSEEIELSDSFSVKSGQTETKDQCYDTAIQNINTTYGDDIKSLKNIKQHVALLRKKKETLENQVFSVNEREY